jgi:hypothetical protein
LERRDEVMWTELVWLRIGTGGELFEVEVEVNLRPTVSRPVCLGVRHPFGTPTNFSFSLKFPLDSCGFGIL